MANMRLRTAALASIFITIIVAACGGGGDEDLEPTATTAPSATATAAAPLDPSAENAFAESLLLTLADFPAGWFHEPAEPEDSEPPSAPFDACIDIEFDGQTGSAIGGEFLPESSARLRISPTVYVFEGAAAAQEAAETIVSSIQCFADLVGDGLDLDEDFAIERAYTEPLAPAAYEATAAIRLYETLIQKSEEPRENILVFDLVIVVDGRVLYEIQGFQRESPIDESLLKLYVDKARVRIRQEP